ncbi:MAG: 6-phosphogluconolactonase [Candidatus Omnitrophica bacterium]|nr:6-phosphogluconolactonase [Candidatus Omnitrophota bacterium]
MTDSHRIHACSSPIQSLASRMVDLLNKIDSPSVAFSGGRTPRDLFSLLAAEYREQVPWSRIKIFQVDERGVPPTHEDSNWRQLQERLLDKISGINAFRMEAENGEAGAEAYAKILDRELPKNESGVPLIDLVLLGMGPDGHTASLFPGTQALEVTDRSVVYNQVPQLDTYRLTLTYPVLQAAGNRWFLLTGKDKAEMFTQVLAGNYPAGKLTDTEWFIDKELASGLHRQE